MPRPARSSSHSLSSSSSSLSSASPAPSSRSRRSRLSPSSKTSPPPPPPPPPPPASTVLLFLIAFRLLNALTVRTFFQPDEFFQSLEPAWQIAFGKNQGAWITWEWRNHLRSSLHPLLFAAIYRVADFLAVVLRASPATRADLLIAAPKTAQAVVAAIGDFYTWKLAGRVYGEGTREAWTVLALTAASPWQWFCSTRTLSNCLETTITVVALDLWPWQWSSGLDQKPGRKNGRNHDADSLLAKLRLCLCLAALACILRPTNILVWITLASILLHRGTWDVRITLIREGIICGSAILAVSTLVDRLFYGLWTFPPLKFLYFNIAQSLAVFYGKNDFHYYISQGLPLLLTTALPFAVVGLYRVATRSQSTASHWQTYIQDQLASICLVMPLALSLISHKEVRFIYPLLPALHILTAPPLVEFFRPAVSQSSGAYTPRRLTLVFLLVVNIFVAIYTTVYHASGTLNVLSYLREQHDRHSSATTTDHHTESSPEITAGFLMPCHSTPWRSHLVHPSITSWALSCEPPVNLNDTEKAAYVDEADQFYANPFQFLRDNMLGGLRHIPRKPSYLSFYSQHARRQQQLQQHQHQTHEWPDYLIFFAQLEPTLQTLLRSSSYAECWRTFNTAWHDDWRRKGDIVVWCLDPGEQLAWRSAAVQKQTLNARNYRSSFGGFVEGFKREAAAVVSGRRRRGNSKWGFPALSTPSITWPWERRKGKTRFPFHWPSSSSLSSWCWPWGKKKGKRAPERDLWS